MMSKKEKKPGIFSSCQRLSKEDSVRARREAKKSGMDAKAL